MCCLFGFADLVYISTLHIVQVLFLQDEIPGMEITCIGLL